MLIYTKYTPFKVTPFWRWHFARRKLFFVFLIHHCASLLLVFLLRGHSTTPKRHTNIRHCISNSPSTARRNLFLEVVQEDSRLVASLKTDRELTNTNHQDQID